MYTSVKLHASFSLDGVTYSKEMYPQDNSFIVCANSELADFMVNTYSVLLQVTAVSHGIQTY